MGQGETNDLMEGGEVQIMSGVQEEYDGHVNLRYET